MPEEDWALTAGFDCGAATTAWTFTVDDLEADRTTWRCLELSILRWYSVAQQPPQLDSHRPHCTAHEMRVGGKAKSSDHFRDLIDPC